MDEEDNAEGTLIDRWIAFDQSGKSLESWLNQFGKSSKKGFDFDYKLLNKVNGDNDTQTVH